LVLDVIGLMRTSTGQFKGGLLLVGAALAASGAVALMVRSGNGANLRKTH